jgi:ketosteroid isomerase-like protein
MEDLRQQLDDLNRRVQALEDELAIHRVIVRYGLAVDIGDADGAADTFTEDTVYDVDVGLMRGRDGVRQMVRSERHQNMVGRCAHQIGPAVVEINGDRAEATGYSRVYLHKDGAIQIYRVSFNHWQLQRRNGQWQIAHRTTRLLGHDDARRVFETALGH